MKSNLKDIIEDIPDFDDLMKVADDIGELSLRKMQLENQLKAAEANVFKTAMNIPVNGKLPSASFVTNSYLHTGINGELIITRDELAFVQSQLDKKKIQLSIYRDMLEVFRTVSANERNIAAY
jgi:hypothetical protein